MGLLGCGALCIMDNTVVNCGPLYHLIDTDGGRVIGFYTWHFIISDLVYTKSVNCMLPHNMDGGCSLLHGCASTIY